MNVEIKQEQKNQGVKLGRVKFSNFKEDRLDDTNSKS